MAAGSTYTPIATQTLGSSASTVTFSSISSAYTDLILVTNATATSGTQAFGIAFNGDTGTNYSYTYLYGNGSSAASGKTVGPNAHIGHVGSVPNTVIAHIQNYSNSTTYKTILAESSLSNSYRMNSAALWSNTAAINSITIIPDSNSFAIGSTFTLYGIASA